MRISFDVLSDILPTFASFWSKGESSVKIELSKTIYSIPDTIYIHAPDFTSITSAAGRILMRKSNETRFKLNLVPPINKLRKSTNCTISKTTFNTIFSAFSLSIFVPCRLLGLLRGRGGIRFSTSRKVNPPPLPFKLHHYPPLDGR